MDFPSSNPWVPVAYAVECFSTPGENLGMEGEETWLDHYNSEFAVPGVTWRITTPMDKWATRYSHLRPIPTYGAFPLTARSHLRPIPTYGPFPLTANSHLRPIPTYGPFPLTARPIHFTYGPFRSPMLGPFPLRRPVPVRDPTYSPCCWRLPTGTPLE